MITALEFAALGALPTRWFTTVDPAAPELRLLVHPRVGAFDASAIAEVFLQAIGAGTDAARVMTLHWRESGWPRVERRPPLATPSGKILHPHQVPAARRDDARVRDAPPITGR
jgi:hypothetical protein